MLHGPRVTSVVKYIIDSYDLLFTVRAGPLVLNMNMAHERARACYIAV